METLWPLLKFQATRNWELENRIDSYQPPVFLTGTNVGGRSLCSRILNISICKVCEHLLLANLAIALNWIELSQSIGLERNPKSWQYDKLEKRALHCALHSRTVKQCSFHWRKIALTRPCLAKLRANFHLDSYPLPLSSHNQRLLLTFIAIRKNKT